jgi:hypothetical protein
MQRRWHLVDLVLLVWLGVGLPLSIIGSTATPAHAARLPVMVAPGVHSVRSVAMLCHGHRHRRIRTSIRGWLFTMLTEADYASRLYDHVNPDFFGGPPEDRVRFLNVRWLGSMATTRWIIARGTVFCDNNPDPVNLPHWVGTMFARGWAPTSPPKIRA